MDQHHGFFFIFLTSATLFIFFFLFAGGVERNFKCILIFFPLNMNHSNKTNLTIEM